MNEISTFKCRNNPSFKLVVLHNTEPRVSTLRLAEYLKYDHKIILNLIRNHKKDFEEFGTLEMLKSKSGKRGRPIIYYDLNEDQSALLCTFLQNTPKVVAVKKQLVWELSIAKKIIVRLLNQKKTPEYLKTRQASKLTRREFTDVIKEFNEYAERQKGEPLNHEYYDLFTMMINNALFNFNGKFENNRTFMTVEQLKTIDTAERIAAKYILELMSQGMEYKKIFQEVKKKILAFAEIYGKSTILSSLSDKQKSLQLQ